MNKPEDQMRWRWQSGDVAIGDNRLTMHDAVADYLPVYRCMNRITIILDRREWMPNERLGLTQLAVRPQRIIP